MKYTCQYCKRDFIKESSLTVHSCEPRRRHTERDEVGVRMGFNAYLKFYELTQGSAKLKTYEDFAESPYYNKVINPARFTEWVLKQNKKLDYWCSDKLYEEYLLQYLKLERMEDALARAIEYSITWSEDKDAPPHDFLRYGNPNTIIHAIISGRISAWVLYTSESGQRFLSELNEEQRSIIWPYIDADVWTKKLREDPANRAEAQEILIKAGW
jgi:hypothetical protein